MSLRGIHEAADKLHEVIVDRIGIAQNLKLAHKSYGRMAIFMFTSNQRVTPDADARP